MFERNLKHRSNCASIRQIIASVVKAPVTQGILTHLGLDAQAPS